MIEHICENTRAFSAKITPFTRLFLQNASSQMFDRIVTTQLTFTCSKSVVETLEKGVKYVQSQSRRSGVFIVNFEHI